MQAKMQAQFRDGTVGDERQQRVASLWILAQHHRIFLSASLHRACFLLLPLPRLSSVVSLGLTSVAMQNACSCSCMMEPILLIQPSSFEQTPTPQQSRFHLKAETTAISLGIYVIPRLEKPSPRTQVPVFFLLWMDERGMMLSLRVRE